MSSDGNAEMSTATEEVTKGRVRMPRKQRDTKMEMSTGLDRKDENMMQLVNYAIMAGIAGHLAFMWIRRRLRERRNPPPGDDDDDHAPPA